MMVKSINRNNPKLAPYINEIQAGGNTNQILQKAIREGAISRSQWQQAKPMLLKYGKQMNINVSQQDIEQIESVFNSNNGGYVNSQTNNKSGFRF